MRLFTYVAGMADPHFFSAILAQRFIYGTAPPPSVLGEEEEQHALALGEDI